MLHFLALKWLVRTLKDVINIVFQLVNSFLEKKVEERMQTAQCPYLVTHGKATLKKFHAIHLNRQTQKKHQSVNLSWK